jgi:hypothetical protein
MLLFTDALSFNHEDVMLAQLNDHKFPQSWIFSSATLGFFALTSITALPAQAIVIPIGCVGESSCTLQELVDGGTIQVSDKLFTDWDVIDASRSFPFLPIPLNLNNIEVIGRFQDTDAPGLEFRSLNNELSIPPGQNLVLNFDFLVTSLGEPMVDNELELVDFEAQGDITGAPPSIITIQENVGTTKGGDDLAQKSVSATVFGGLNPPRPEIKAFDRATFPPQQSVWVRKNISLSSGPEGSASLNQFTQRFSQQRVPEPTSTLSLLALGTLGAASTLKRKLKPSKTAKKETEKVG